MTFVDLRYFEDIYACKIRCFPSEVAGILENKEAGCFF